MRSVKASYTVGMKRALLTLSVLSLLLSTGELILKPDHHQEPDAPVAWRYYKILTRIRAELQKRK